MHTLSEVYSGVVPFSVSRSKVHSGQSTSSGPPPTSAPKPGTFSERYDKFISKWPRIYALHRMVVDGSRWCLSDVKTYIRVRRELFTKTKKLDDLSMDELEVLVQSGGELAKILALVVVLQIPGPGDILILLIFFPRLVLTRHFWTDAQRKEFFRTEVLKSMTNSSRVKEIALASVYSMLPLPGIARRFKLRCEAMRQLDKIIVGSITSLTERQLNFVRFFPSLEQLLFSIQKNA
ncbi:unnamed protein product [Angiostrongylus costaricensis]|uniref:LETM1 domain-containing protein n=1 Tax=Angiostrongylus costaricensis TaxID=334426 RepID=A0A0R3PK59_ANGCS|nr:unnamed protein product [Angiostrongylus costaricensis]